MQVIFMYLYYHNTLAYFALDMLSIEISYVTKIKIS